MAPEINRPWAWMGHGGNGRPELRCPCPSLSPGTCGGHAHVLSAAARGGSGVLRNSRPRAREPADADGVWSHAALEIRAHGELRAQRVCPAHLAIPPPRWTRGEMIEEK